MNAPAKKQKSLEKRLNSYNSRRIIYGKIPHSGIFGTIFSFYYYIFMRQTRNTGRCPVLAITSSSSYMPSIFWLFSVRAGGLFFGIHGPSLFILQVLCTAISDLVRVQHCLSACSWPPQPPSGGPIASPASPFCLLNGTIRDRDVWVRGDDTWDPHSTGFPARPLEKKWFPVLAPTKDKAQDPHRCLPACADPLQTLYGEHSSEGVGSLQLLKDTQRFAGCSNLFNLWLGPGMSTMERHYGSRQRRLTLLAICHCH